MILAQYNHFLPATKTIAEGEESKDAYLILDDNVSIPLDYTNKSQDIEVIEAANISGAIDYLAASLLMKLSVTALGFNSFSSTAKDLIGKHNAADTVTELIPFYESLGMTTQQATDYHGLRRLQNLKANRDACNLRYEDIDSPTGWYSIILQFFNEYDAFAIKKAALEQHIPNYREDALLGGTFDIGLIGIIDFFNNTNGVGTSLENFPLKDGVSDYTVVQGLLTKIFAI